MRNASIFPALWMGLLTGLLAQSPPAQPAAPAPPAAATAPAATPPVLVKERSVYIPFDDLAKTLTNEGQGVFLPYREFLEMWNQLNVQQQKAAERSPVDAVLSSVEYSGKVDGSVAVLTATLNVESFKESGWATLPLAGAGWSIAKAETGEATLNLKREDNRYELLLPKKGKYAVKLDVMARVERNSGRHFLRLVLPKSPVSRCTFTIPEVGWEFRLTPGAAFTTVEKDGATEMSFFTGEVESMEISWQKLGGESKLTPLIFAEVRQKAMAASGSLHNTLEIDYRILRAGVDKFTLAIPKPHEVLSVAGENIKEWNVAPGAADAPQELTLTLHTPARDQYHLQVDLEAGIDALPAEVAVPRVEARDVMRQRGTLTIEAAAELDAAVANLSGLTQQELAGPAPAAPNPPPNAQPAGANAPPPPPATAAVLGSYRYLKLPYAASLTLKRAEPQVEVSSFTLTKIGLDVARFVSRFDVMVKRSGIFDMRIDVPQDFDGMEATGPVVDTSAVETEGQKKFLRVKFKARSSGAFSFLVTGRRIREAADQPVLVPVFSPQNVSRHEAVAGVALHESLDPNTKDMGGMRQEDVAGILSSLPEYGAQVQQKPQAGPGKSSGGDSSESGIAAPSLAFRYRGEAAPATIQLKLKQSQVTGDVLTMVEMREQAARYRWMISYSVQYAGVDSFLIRVPRSIAKDLRLDTRDIKEVDKNFTPPAGPKESPEQRSARYQQLLKDLAARQQAAQDAKATAEQKDAAKKEADRIQSQLKEIEKAVEAERKAKEEKKDPAAPPKPAEEAKQTQQPPPAPAEETDLWKVTLRDKRMGQVTLDFSLEVPMKELQPGQGAEISVPELSLQDVFQEIGQVAVAKDSNLEVTKAQAGNLEAIDPKELRGMLSQPGVILAYKMLRRPAALKLVVSKNVFLDVPQAMVTYAVLNTVVSTDAASSTEVIYWVKNNSQQFFSVELPPRGRLLSDVFVNGEPQQPMRRPDKNDILIRLPGGQVGAEFPIRFLYEVPPEKESKALGMSGQFTVEPPKLNAGIMQSQLTLYLPRDFVYLDFKGPMRPAPRAAGWSDPRRRLRWLIPSLGPDIEPVNDSGWAAPPALPAASTGGFNLDLPRDGQKFPLHRLDEPRAVTVHYRSATLDKAVFYLAMLGAFLVGILMTRRKVEVKAAYFGMAGLGSLVVRHLMTPAWAPLWEAVWLGTLLALVVWAIVGFLRMLTPVHRPAAPDSPDKNGGGGGKGGGGSSGGSGGGSGPTASEPAPAPAALPGLAVAAVSASGAGAAATSTSDSAVSLTLPANGHGALSERIPIPVERDQILFREGPGPGSTSPSVPVGAVSASDKAWYEKLALAGEPVAPPPASQTPPADEPIAPFPMDATASSPAPNPA